MLARLVKAARRPMWAAACAVRGYADECGGLIKYPKGAPCFPPIPTGSEHREFSPCLWLHHPIARPCLDLSRVEIIKATASHARLIRSFLFTHHWPRDPVTTSLWMSLQSEYLEIITERYAFTGDRFLAFEHQERVDEPKLIGVLHADSVFPWEAGELEEWASRTCNTPDRNRMFFQAHLLRAPRIFERYHANHIYKIEVVVTAPEVQGRGVATKLLRHALVHSNDTRHPVTVIAAVSDYMNKPCQRCKMKREWAMDYSDFIDNRGQHICYPRRPHTKVIVYSKPLDPNPGVTDADAYDYAK